MKRIFLTTFLAMTMALSSASSHKIIVRDEDDENKPLSVVKIDDDGFTETITITTDEDVEVLIYDAEAHLYSSHPLTAELNGGVPLTIPDLAPGWYAEICVNNQVVYIII